ncbi:hypothetical protein Dimus_039130 [Dionaea muscipula]
MQAHCDYNNVNVELKAVALGPIHKVSTYPVYFINGYVFHIEEYAQRRKTWNCGVCIKGTNYNVEGSESDFYGILNEIVVVKYSGLPLKQVTLFSCKWFDPLQGTRVYPQYNLVEINHKKKYRKYEPFVLAQQAQQVYFTTYPNKKNDKRDWWVVCKVKGRGLIDAPQETYQEEVTEVPPQTDIVGTASNALINDDEEFEDESLHGAYTTLDEEDVEDEEEDEEEEEEEEEEEGEDEEGEDEEEEEDDDSDV